MLLKNIFTKISWMLFCIAKFFSQVEEKPDVTYSDVGGCKEQIEKLREVVETPLLHVCLYYYFIMKMGAVLFNFFALTS